MRNNLRNYYTNAITNKWQTDALNQMYPNYAVSPGVGGRMHYKPGDKKFTGTGGKAMTQAEAYRQCRQMNPGATDQTNCVKQLMGSQGGNSATGANANIGMGMYGNQQPTGKKKGGTTNNKGYLYLDSWLPFLM